MKLSIKSLNTRRILLFLILISCTYWMGMPLVVARGNDAQDPGQDLLQDSLQEKLQDEELTARTLAILKADSTRRADSLKQEALLDELSQLKTTDNLKKAELLAEIEQLRNAEKRTRAEQKQQIDSLRAISEGHPVILHSDTLFYIYTKLGPFTPQLRAEHTIQQLDHIIKQRDYIPDSLQLIRSADAVDLVYHDKMLLTVTVIDALWADTDMDELAAHYKELVHTYISKALEQTQLIYILKNMLAVLVILLVLYFIIKYVNKLYRRVRLYVLKGRGKWYHGINIRDYELFSVEMQARVLVILLNILKWVLILTFVYFALLLLFGIFPWTKPIADTLLEYATNPIRKIAAGIWSYLPDLFTVIIILIIFRYVLKGLAYFRDEVDRGALSIPGFYSDWAKPTFQVIRILLFAFMIVIIYPYLPGSDSPVFQGVSVLLGVLLTFGSSSSLSNIISGLVLTYTRAFKVGDRVRIGESVGDIIEKNLLVTRIRTVNNEDITIPNSAVMNSHTINYSTAAEDFGLCISTTIRVSYEVPWRQVHELLIDAAKKTKGVIPEPGPYVVQKSLDDFSVRYEINAYTNLPNKQAGIFSGLHENIQDNFRQAGISLIAPTIGQGKISFEQEKSGAGHELKGDKSEE